MLAEQSRAEQSRAEQSRAEQSRAGIPIGNLTSQIFANIYLNELDRFVRHHLKPCAYVRYGDDFILVVPTRKRAYEVRSEAMHFLRNDLMLSINPKNDKICATKDGLHFLGHAITDKFCLVDMHTSKSVITKLTISNAASYKSLLLTKDLKEKINRDLLKKIFALYD